MTIDEAIEVIEYARAFNEENTPLMKAWDLIIDYVRAQQEAEKNEPLSLGDLRELDGQPVYVTKNEHSGIWALVFHYLYLEEPQDVLYLTYSNGAACSAEFMLNDGAKIYRHPPEKEEPNG